jgi:hypothetical protein
VRDDEREAGECVELGERVRMGMKARAMRRKRRVYVPVSEA